MMLFGLMGLGFGRLGVAGFRGGGSVAPPATPTLTLTSGASDNTPAFSLTGDLVTGDTVRIQYSTASDFSGALAATTVIDAPADAANELDFSVDPLDDLTWYFRARIERPSTPVSNWSNTVTERIIALQRLSAIHLTSPWRSILPPPDTSIGASDRKTVAGFYGSL